MKLKMRLKPPRIRLPSLKIESLQELTLLVGFLMFMRGLWLIYPPAMWLIGGMYLMTASVRKGGGR